MLAITCSSTGQLMQVANTQPAPCLTNMQGQQATMIAHLLVAHCEQASSVGLTLLFCALLPAPTDTGPG